MVYTNFVSMISQDPAVLKVLPLNFDRTQATTDSARGLMLYEPSSEEVYDRIVPQYVSGILYGAVAESLASEPVSYTHLRTSPRSRPLRSLSSKRRRAL